MSTPLCINFLQIVNSNPTSFSRVMGDANIVPVFGQTFTYVFPILLLILIVVNIFDVYTMIARLFKNFLLSVGRNSAEPVAQKQADWC